MVTHAKLRTSMKAFIVSKRNLGFYELFPVTSLAICCINICCLKARSCSQCQSENSSKQLCQNIMLWHSTWLTKSKKDLVLVVEAFTYPIKSAQQISPASMHIHHIDKLVVNLTIITWYKQFFRSQYCSTYKWDANILSF